jgi:predicted RNase H-like nuclease (RuvC/YqgF family)
MAKTNADYQREHRERRTRRIAGLEARVAELEAELESVRAENEGLRQALEAAEGMQCRHPSGAVSGGTCRACGQDVW